MTRLLLTTFMCLSLVACIGSDCGDDCGYYAQEPVWSEDDSKLALTIPDFGDSYEETDNQYFIYTLNIDGSDFSPVYELAKPAHVKSFNHTKSMALLEIDPQRFSETFYGFDWVNFSTNQQLNLLQVGPTQKNCFYVDASASLDFSHIAIIYTPFNSCNEENTHLVFFNTDEQTFDDVLEVHNNFKNRFTPSIYYTWTDQGLLVQNYAASSRNEFILLDPATKQVSSYTRFVESCGNLDTNSTRYSATGLTAEVTGFVGQNEAIVMLEQGNHSFEACE